MSLIRLDFADGRRCDADAPAQIGLRHVVRATTALKPRAKREFVHSAGCL
jgi:hypothetical protein